MKQPKTLDLVIPKASKSNKHSPNPYVATGCRRCGPECSCSEEELDAGGPA